MKRWSCLFGLAVALVLASVLWAAALLVCPKCGYEAQEGATVCAHCGAALPASSKAAGNVAPPTNAATLADDISSQALVAARADMRLAEENRAGRPEMACAYYENALAIGRLVKRQGQAPDAGKALTDGLEGCRQALSRATRTCPVCNGSGKRTVQFHGLTADKGIVPQVAEGLTCLNCKGAGIVRAARSPDDLRVLLAQGRRDFDTRQQAAGRVACGRAWLPPDLNAKLDVRAQALVRTACAPPCQECMGLGVQSCPRCKGEAHVKCTNTGCTDGWIVRKPSNTLLEKAVINRREPCPVCMGSGFMPCPECRGNGNIPCKQCRGTGANPVCQDCGGQGWSACQKCRGTGKLSGDIACPDCQGKGERLCPRCHGEGCALR